MRIWYNLFALVICYFWALIIANADELFLFIDDSVRPIYKFDKVEKIREM